MPHTTRSNYGSNKRVTGSKASPVSRKARAKPRASKNRGRGKRKGR